MAPENVARSVAEVGIGFAFAPQFHPSYRHAAVVRREIGVPTVFNLLGPLTNPACPARGLIGCAWADLAEVMAGVFADSPVQRAGGARRRRTRRADHHHDEHDLAGAGRHCGTAERSTPRRSASAGPISSQLVGGDAEANAAEVAGGVGGRTGPSARCGAAQRGGRDGGTCRASQRRRMAAAPGSRGWPGPPPRSTPGRPKNCSRVGCGSHRRSSSPSNRRRSCSAASFAERAADAQAAHGPAEPTGIA